MTSIAKLHQMERINQDARAKLNRLQEHTQYGPDTWVIVTTAVLKAIMLSTGGETVRSGLFFDIQKKSLGAGVYRIWLTPKEM